MSDIKVGIAQVDFTPRLGLPLIGNYRDDYGARGIHDPLYAKAIVFADAAGQKAALLTIDICMFDRDNTAMMRGFIASECDILSENILIAATHSHSGPSPVQLGGCPKADDNDIEAFLKKAATAVVLANRNLIESKLAVGYSSETRVSFNRRLKCKDGQTHMNWEALEPDFVVEPLGPIDSELITLMVTQQDKPKAALVNFALHPAVLAGDNWLYSADYPGYLAEAMSKFYDSEFATLFFNGCCGNINHIDYSDKTQGRGFKMTQRIGHMLAVDAFEAIKNQTEVAANTIAVSRQMVLLERYQISNEQVDWSKEVLEKAKSNPTPGQVDGMPDEYYARLWLKMHENQDKPDPVEVMAIRIGDVGIVGLPGEIFCEFGIQIKKQSPAKHTIVIELANDAIEYIPVKQSFAQGGYESTPGSTMYAPGSGEKLVDSALNQLEKLFKGPY